MAKRRGEVTSIKDLFAKYKHTLVAPQQTVEVEAVRVVGELLGLRLKETQVSYTVSTKTLAITGSSMIKQEVKMKEKEVLAELKKRLGVKNSPQVIL